MWEVDRLRESLERRSWELEERERDFFVFEERRKRELACEEEELALKRVRFLGDVRVGEVELDLRLRALNERAEWLEMAEAEAVEIRRQLSERLENIEAEGERFRLDRESLSVREKKLDDRISAVEKKEEEFNLFQAEKMREIKLKEENLAEKVRVWEEQMLKHRFMERIELAEKKLDGVRAKMDERFEAIECRQNAGWESLALIVKEADFIRESAVEKKLDELEKMKTDFTSFREEKIRELDSKEQLLNVMNEELIKKIDSRNEQLKQQCSTNVFNAPLDIEPNESADLKFTVRMDGKTLQMFLNDAEKDIESMGDEIFKVLHLSSDPAKLVLDAMVGFYPPHLRKEDAEFNVRRTCITLLEQLIKMSPKIKTNVRKEAIKVAKSWRSKMIGSAENGRSMEVIGFLFLLSAFNLASYFDKDEISSFLMMVDQHREAPELHCVLGSAMSS